MSLKIKFHSKMKQCGRFLCGLKDVGESSRIPLGVWLLLNWNSFLNLLNLLASVQMNDADELVNDEAGRNTGFAFELLPPEQCTVSAWEAF